MLFAQKGLKDTAIADIMQKANLGIGTFYNYFQSKDDLLRSLLIQLAMNIRQHYLESLNKEKNTSTNTRRTRFIHGKSIRPKPFYFAIIHARCR